MREFLEVVLRLLVRSPEQVEITETVEEGAVVYEVSVASEDVGRIIGRDGRVIRAIRGLLRAAAARRGIRVALQVR
jgi:predicted RNA-binding protein YlqC (UPF0109 family)